MPTLRQACFVDALRTPGQATFKGDAGEIMLPGAVKPYGIEMSMASVPDRTPHGLRRIWVTLCITYQDSRGGWHFSGYRYISVSGNATPIAVEAHPDWTYLPFNGMSLVAADAN